MSNPLIITHLLDLPLRTCSRALVARSRGSRALVTRASGVGSIMADELERRRGRHRVPAYLARLLRRYALLHQPPLTCFFFSDDYFLGKMQKRPRSTEGSRWRPFLCSRTSIALPDGGSARFRRRLASASSSGRSTLFSFFFVSCIAESYQNARAKK